MKITLLTFHIFIVSFAVGQNNEDYTLYHEKILLIDQCNSRDSFDSSLVMYADIFGRYDRVLAKDAYNACQIAALKKHKNFSDFFYTCAKSGITKSRLMSNGLIRSQFSPDSVKLNSLYAKGFKNYLNRIDTSLRKEMIQRFETEQKIKGKVGYAKVCQDNFNRILELAREGKFPGENIIGNTDFMESFVFPTLCHYPYSYKVMEPYLIDALNKGKVNPMALIYLYGFNQTRTSILYTSDIPVDSVSFTICYNMPFGKQSTDFVEVNKQRSIKKIYSMRVQKNLRDLISKYGIDYDLGY